MASRSLPNEERAIPESADRALVQIVDGNKKLQAALPRSDSPR